MASSRNWLATILVGLCGCGASPLGRSGEADIGLEGGAITAGPVRVIIPAGALQKPTHITITPAMVSLPPGNVLPPVNLGPEGTQFAIPATVEFAFDAAALPDPDHPEELIVATVQDDSWAPLDDAEVDVAGGVVRGTTLHFSPFGVIRNCNNTGCLSCGRLPRCCVPVCGRDEILVCVGANICGYPCRCIKKCQPSAEVCNDGLDNDCDGAVDCKDPDCAKDPACPPACIPSGPEICNDGIDNDCNGLVDCRDARVCTGNANGVNPGCCYPICGPGETLQCLGRNICGYPCSCVPKCNPVAEVCNDNADNDCDGLVDCDDPDCANARNCATCVPTGPEVCNDGIDNDCNGLIDCADTNVCTGANSGINGGCCYPICPAGETLQCLGANICGYPCSCVPACKPVAEVCSDGVDNDCDGLVDCKDPDCANARNCATCVPTGPEVCNDGIDNDCNGLIDCADTNVCTGANGGVNGGCCYPICPAGETLQCLGANICGYPCSCVPVCQAVSEICNDGVDNDCDGLVDCKDPDCANAANCAPCVPTGPEVCNDGVDNDCNGLIDCADTNVCTGANGGVNGGCCYPICPAGETLQCLGANICGYPCSCVPACKPVAEVCNDGLDNDCDGNVDCKDADCANHPACANTRTCCFDTIAMACVAACCQNGGCLGNCFCSASLCSANGGRCP